MDKKLTGTIIKLNEKGFGFAKVEGYQKEIFFHATQVRNAPFNSLAEGDELLINSVEQGTKGLVCEGVYLASADLGE